MTAEYVVRLSEPVCDVCGRLVEQGTEDAPTPDRGAWRHRACPAPARPRWCHDCRTMSTRRDACACGAVPPFGRST